MAAVPGVTRTTWIARRGTEDGFEWIEALGCELVSDVAFGGPMKRLTTRSQAA